ncbi:MAG: restriction endonuclease subunit S, partial [Candidatus Auribacterota bacterium]|nr:restriction endonuclease subunit S [Candidatus Auribacterota bacterium]
MKVVDSSNTINLLDQEAFETANGLWKGKKPPYVEVGVIRNTNFTNSGRIDLTDVARLPVEEKKLKTRTLQPGDIILERSGGGPKQPVGRVVYFNESDGKWSFSNFTSMIRVRDRKRFNSKYIFYILLHFYDSGATDPLQRRTTGIRNLDWKAYKESVSVPLWPLPEQYRIVAVLSLVQRAIEEQERLIQLTTELKKALMHKLFTEGTRGEPQKQTEIGPIPESWEMVEIADIFKFTSGKTKPRDTKPAPIDENQIPVYGGNGVLGYSSQFMLEESTLILGR